jgi:hypothetical protein
MELDEYTDPTEYGDHEEHGEHDVTEYDEEEDMRSIEIKTCTLSLKRESYAYTNPDIRSKVASKLKSKYSDKNGEILEKHIHNATVNY